MESSLILFPIISFQHWKMFLVYIWDKHYWIKRIMICRLRLCVVVFAEENSPNSMNSDTVFSLRREDVEHSSKRTTRTSISVSMLKLLATWSLVARGPPRKRASSSAILPSMGVTWPVSAIPLVPILTLCTLHLSPRAEETIFIWSLTITDCCSNVFIFSNPF